MFSLAELSALAGHYFGEKGRWSYAAYADIKARFFDERLPVPLITWGITPHSKCIGYASAEQTGPVVMLHQSLLGGTETDAPWGIDPSLLGYGYAHDVLLHELMHVNIRYVLDPEGKQRGATSHNSDPWVDEVNRIAPLLGLGALRAGRSKLRRVKVDAESIVMRGVEAGCVDFKAVGAFPHSFRRRLDQTEFYRAHQSAAAFAFP